MEDSDRLEQFKAFYEATKTPVFRAVLLARAGDRHASEDAVAEAYERAFLRWEKLTHHPNPTGWVIRTAINHRISMWRRHRREEPQVAAPVAPGPDLLDPSLMRLIRELPKGQREVLALRVLLDFSTEQTAQALGVKQGTVKKLLHRALQELRMRLIAPETEEVQGWTH
jgi:DNA-directed RNA polymerase specialized sigma24 family protein